MNHLTRWITIGLTSSLAIATGCKKPVSDATTVERDPKVERGQVVFPADSSGLATLSIEAVKPKPQALVLLNGRLTWDDNATVRVFSPLAGRVGHIHVELGATIEKGAPLMDITSPDFGQAQADARKATADLAQAERNLQRLRELSEHGAAAAKDVLNAEADLSRAQAESARTQARLAVYDATTDHIDNNYVLKSPLSGIVVEKNVNPGQEVRPDQMLAGTDRLAAPLVTITDPSRLWLQLDVSEADLPPIHTGQTVALRASAMPDRSFPAIIDVISDSLDPITRTARIRASLPNLDRSLKAEMLVRVEVQAADQQALDVPSRAVFLRGERHFVFVEVGHGRFDRREVRVGPALRERLQVLDGLRADERVVTDGAMLLEQLWEQSGPEPATRVVDVAAGAPTRRGDL